MKHILNQELKYFIQFFQHLTLRDHLTDDEIQFLLKLYKLYAVDRFFEEDLHIRFSDKTPDQLQKMMATLSQLNFITQHPNGSYTFTAKTLCQFKKMQLI